jgi:hypothetical protein
MYITASFHCTIDKGKNETGCASAFKTKQSEIFPTPFDKYIYAVREAATSNCSIIRKVKNDSNTI